MDDIKKLSDSLTAVLKDDEFQNTSVDILESFSDAMLKDGLLKEFPILGTLLGGMRTAANIKDLLFTKKIVQFLYQIKNIPKEQKRKQIDKIEDDKKYRTKVGERLLYIIDKSEDTEKAEIIGKLFNAFLREKIDYSDFLRCSTCVEKAFLPDLLNFIESNIEISDIRGASNLISSGLMEIDQISPKIITDKNRYSSKMEPTLRIKNSEIKCSITYIGEMIRDILHNQ